MISFDPPNIETKQLQGKKQQPLTYTMGTIYV